MVDGLFHLRGGKNLGLLIEEYYRRFPAFRGKETVTWCFDEIQMNSGWERFGRRLLDNEKVGRSSPPGKIKQHGMKEKFSG